MVTEGITEAQRAALSRMARGLPDRTYLAGGVAIALEMHHRLSLDLDLFVPTAFDEQRLMERLATDVPSFTVSASAEGTLEGELEGVPITILSYRYPLLAPTRRSRGLAVPSASLEDLGCMKIAAVAGRGMAKDFWDLDVLLAHGVASGDLAQLLDRYRAKFPSQDVGHAVRSLAYFGDAEGQPLPRGLGADAWREIKGRMEGRVVGL